MAQMRQLAYYFGKTQTGIQIATLPEDKLKKPDTIGLRIIGNTVTEISGKVPVAFLKQEQGCNEVIYRDGRLICETAKAEMNFFIMLEQLHIFAEAEKYSDPRLQKKVLDRILDYFTSDLFKGGLTMENYWFLFDQNFIKVAA
ncbi:MAG: hypothetical protein PHC97_03390 [Patescibacteria group bacterium]|nr:hypothetical protein [Patescibacteria group bacterium]